MNISRLRLVLVMMVIALLAAACGGDTPPANTPSGDNNTTTTSGGPADVAKAFFDALYSGGDVTSHVCETSPEIAASFEQAAQAAASAMANADISTSGLTYTVSEETADRATVQVGGNVTYTISGTGTDVPLSVPVTLTNVNGAWKICA